MEADYKYDLPELSAVNTDRTVENFSMHSLLESQSRHVELLSHLASYSELLVAVTGPVGAGKSFIANSLAAQREEPDETVLLTASVMLGMPSILAAIASHWDMPSVNEDSVEAREAIKNEAVSRSESGGNLLLIIDQADQLDAETLNDLAHFALLAPQALSVVLFGVPGYETQFRNSPAQAPLHVLGLEPLTINEIHTLLTQAYGDGEDCVLSQSELSELMMSSDCLPGSVLEHAQQILTATARTHTAGSKGFPLRNTLAIAGIVTIIAMVGLSQLATEPPVINSTVLIEDVVDPVERTPIADFNYPEARQEALSSVAEPATDSLAVGTETSMDIPEQPASLTEAQNTKSNLEVATSDSSEVSEIIKSSSSVNGLDASAVVDTPNSDKLEPAELSHGGGEHALLLADSGYIVQLFGSFSEESASKFGDTWQNQLTGTLYRYQTVHQNRDWFVVVAGIYATRNEAVAAVNTMPERLRSQSPWIRPISDAQSAIR